MSKLIKAAAAATAMLAGSAYAVSNGFYVGVDGNIDFSNIESKQISGGSTDDDSKVRFGADIFAGYGHTWPENQLYLGGEIFWGKAFWGDKKTKVGSTAEQKHSNSYEFGGYVVPGFFYDDWLFYGKIGYGMAKYNFEGSGIKNDDDTTRGLLLGVGAAYEWPLEEGASVGVRAEYIHGFYNKYDVKNTSSAITFQTDVTQRQFKLGFYAKFDAM